MNAKNLSSQKEIIIEQAIAQNVKGGQACSFVADICYVDFCSCEMGDICTVNACSAVISGQCPNA